MKHHAIVFKAGFGFCRAKTIKADRTEERGEQTVFFFGARAVFQAPTSYLSEIHKFEHQADAAEFVRELLSRKAGAATFHVREYGVARPKKNAIKNPKGGFLAESVVTVFED